MVRNRVTNPFDVIEELAVASNAVLLGDHNAFDKILWVAVDDEQRRGWLVTIFECIGVLGF